MDATPALVILAAAVIGTVWFFDFIKSYSKLNDKLNSYFPWNRKLAIEELASFGVPAVDALMLIMSTPYSYPNASRRQAMAELIRMGSPAIEQIIEAMNTMSLEDQLILKTSGFIQYNSSVIEGRALLNEVLIELGSPVVEKLHAALNHSNRDVRVLVMSMLGRIGDPSSVGFLIPFLDSRIDEEREWAISALGNMRALDAFERILAALSDSNPSVRRTAIYALEKYGDTRAWPALEFLAQIDHTEFDRYPMSSWATEAINKIRKQNNKRPSKK